MSQPLNDAYVSYPLLRQGTSGRLQGWEFLPRMTTADAEGPNPGHPIRASTNSFPGTTSVQKQFEPLPITIVAQPMAKITVPSVPYILRCTMCKAYISCYSVFIQEGRKWQCSLCKQVMDVPQGYYSPLDPNTGYRTDIAQRPELQYGSVEFHASADYGQRPAQPPVILFMLDVSFTAVSSGTLATTIDGIKRWAFLKTTNEEKENVVRYGLMTFDRSVTLYVGVPSLKIVNLPEQHTDEVPVVEGVSLESRRVPFNPQSTLLSLQQWGDNFFTALDLILESATNTRVADACVGPALTTAMQLLDSTGGKIVAVLGSIGPGYGYPKQENAATFYLERGIVCNLKQISMDVHHIATSSNHHQSDLAAVHNCVKMCSGRLKTYPDAAQLAEDFVPYLDIDRAHEAMIRARCSRGVKISACYGGCYVKQQPDLVVLPVCDASNTYCLKLELDGGHNLPADVTHIFVQITIMYTNEAQGHRKLRVHNYAIPVVKSVAAMYSAIDSAAMAVSMIRPAIDDVLHDPTVDPIGQVLKQLEGALIKFRSDALTIGQRHSTSTHLVLPIRMQCLPQLIFGFFRSPACVPVDPMRLSLLNYLLSGPVPIAALRLSPVTYNLYNPKPAADTPAAPYRQVPTSSLQLVEDSLSNQSVSYIDAGIMTALVIGKDVSPVYLENLLGTASLDVISQFRNPPENTKDGTLRELTAYRNRGTFVAPFKVIIAGKPTGVKEDNANYLPQFLMEDVAPRTTTIVTDPFRATLSYVTLLIHLKNKQLQK